MALVTGAGSGVGRAIAAELGRRGATVVATGRQREPLDSLAAQVNSSGGVTDVVTADLTVDTDLTKITARLVDHHGRLDLLVHSAGLLRTGTVENAAIEDLDLLHRVNVRAPWLLTQSLLPQLRNDRGQVVFINSSSAVNARSGTSQYAATKHAEKALADSLREEVNPLRIRVLSVFLGRTATPMQQRLHHSEGKAYQPDRLLQPEDVAAVVLVALELPATAEVTDVHLRPLMKPDGV